VAEYILSSLTLNVKCVLGHNVETAVNAGLHAAKATGLNIFFEFNGYKFTLAPNSTTDDILGDYRRWLQGNKAADTTEAVAAIDRIFTKSPLLKRLEKDGKSNG